MIASKNYTGRFAFALIVGSKAEMLSLSDIKDVLMEEHLYEKQDKASGFLADAWREFDRRKSALGQSYPI